MRNLFKFFIVILLFSCNKNEEPKEQVNNDSTGENSTPGILLKSMKKFIQPNHKILLCRLFGLDSTTKSSVV